MIYHCFILARRNSKRITNKNLINFKGKPLLYWTLKQSLRLKKVKKIIVSSDSPKIIDLAKKVSKKFILNNRPKELSKGNTTSETTMKYLIKKYKIRNNDYILLLQPTSPLRKTKDINNVLDIAKKKKIKSIHSVSSYSGKKKIDANLIITNRGKPMKKNKLSFNGSIYLFRTSLLNLNNSIYQNPQYVYITDKKNSLDIDTYSDLKK